MFKLKKNNILNKTIKIISFIMVILFSISVSFAGESSLTPLNFLNKRVDSVKRDIERNNAEGEAIVKNLYSNNLKKVDLVKINPMLDSVKSTTAVLNNKYLGCDLKNNDILNILYKSNDDFKKQIKNTSSEFTEPQREDMIKGCSKLMTCVLKKSDGSKIIDSLSYCKAIVNDTYLNEYKNTYQLSSLSKANEGNDAFRNKSLEDSSYDILNDVYTIARILFETPEEPNEVLFYSMPNLGEIEEDSDLLSMINDWFSPYYQIENSGGNNGGSNGNSGDNSEDGNNGNGGNDGGDGNNIPNIQIDDEIIEFTQTTTYEIEGKDGYEFLGNDCIDPFEIEGYDGYSYTNTEIFSGIVSGNTITTTQYSENINNNIDYLNCEYDENCIQQPGTNGDTEPGDESLNQPINNILSGIDQQTLSCFESCNNISCNATSCDRLGCYAKCLCKTYESPFFDPTLNPGLGPIFKLKFCIQPVQDHKVVKAKKAKTLESIVNEINGVIQKLRNSGELMLNQKTKEYMEAGFAVKDGGNDFSKEISINIDGFEKVPEGKGSEKQEKEDQINLNTSLMEVILGFEKEESKNSNGRNKYIIRGGTIKNGTLSTTQQENTNNYEPIENNSDIIGSLNTSHLNNIGSEVGNFLQGNVDFWQSFKNSMMSLKTISESLANKK